MEALTLSSNLMEHQDEHFSRVELDLLQDDDIIEVIVPNLERKAVYKRIV
jgi:hypothetical protein